MLIHAGASLLSDGARGSYCTDTIEVYWLHQILTQCAFLSQPSCVAELNGENLLLLGYHTRVKLLSSTEAPPLLINVHPAGDTLLV